MVDGYCRLTRDQASEVDNTRANRMDRRPRFCWEVHPSMAKMVCLEGPRSRRDFTGVAAFERELPGGDIGP